MYEATIAAVTALIVGLLGALGTLLTIIWKNRERQETLTVRNLQTIIDRQERRIGLLEQQGEQWRTAVEKMVEEHADCQVKQTEIYSYCIYLYETASRYRELLRKAGHESGAIRPPPPKPNGDPGEGEFLHRQAEQSSRLMAETKKLDPDTKGP